ncbi:hypothetical protein [Goodfellowiella coeruleoviolacea]|uniref:hypothetical protein n=1 Tax=Goodfellowiella coeruleoviolacea TaxID=334858 RepID=UPI0020A4D233|nr:hypothetical protein [Goodfellowiella coeruleoviolacea]
MAALVYAAFLRSPENSPAEFVERGRAGGTRQVVVAAGSSSTKATLSADWVGLLRDQFGPAGYDQPAPGRGPELRREPGPGRLQPGHPGGASGCSPTTCT